VRGSSGQAAVKPVANLVRERARGALSGSLALSLPIAWIDAGLPIGIQFVAQLGREDVLLPLARVLEQDCKWEHRRSPVHVSKM